MKWKIADMMDGLEEQNIELQDADVSAARVLARTREKLAQEASPRRRGLRRGALVAAACAVTILLGCAVGAALDWHGFALREELTQAERGRIYEELAYGTATEEVDREGNVTIRGREGEVIAEMTAEEYRAWEQEQEAMRLERAQAGSALLDITTMELAPSSITELNVAAGAIPEFMLGNGHMVLLRQETGGWQLEKGDQVTIHVEAVNEPCNFIFGMVRETVMVEEGTVFRSHLEDGQSVIHPEAQQPEWTFTIPEDGEYYFTMVYGSVSADEFVNGTLTVTEP